MSRTNGKQIEPKAVVSDACASFGTLEYINDDLRPNLQAVTQTTDFFSYYRLNLYNKKCPFWNDESGMCGNIACAVQTLDDEKDIPPIWRAEELSKLQGPKAKHPGRKLQKERGNKKPLQGRLGDKVGESCVVEYDDECDERDYCVPEDESVSAKGDYVSLLDNPERFTGYSGEGANGVWNAIYRENCFSKQMNNSADASSPTPPLFQKAKQEIQSVMQANINLTDFLPDDTCLEKRVFYRIISGMHASISTHLCYDYLNQTTGTWGPNIRCYRRRLADHPDHVSNLYFNYALVTRALGKLQNYLKTYTFCSGDPAQDMDTKSKVLALAQQAASTPPIFDEKLMFADPAGVDLKEDFRQRFRNVSRIMDCVGCDKCRLWGKVQTQGYGTALKILFEFNEEDPENDFYLGRTELVALVNTLNRISHSISALAHFRRMLNPSGKYISSYDEKHGGIPDFDSIEKVESSPSSPPKKETKPKPAVESPAASKEPVMFTPEDDDYDRDYEPPRRPEPDPNRTASDEAMDEIRFIWKVFLHVMHEWWGLPKKLGSMAVFELSRIWSYWLGIPVPEIIYHWMTPPMRDEL